MKNITADLKKNVLAKRVVSNRLCQISMIITNTDWVTSNRKVCIASGNIVHVFSSLSEASFRRSKKQGRGETTAFSVRVEDGARTHDLRNHNPTF